MTEKIESGCGAVKGRGLKSKPMQGADGPPGGAPLLPLFEDLKGVLLPPAGRVSLLSGGAAIVLQDALLGPQEGDAAAGRAHLGLQASGGEGVGGVGGGDTAASPELP